MAMMTKATRPGPRTKPMTDIEVDRARVFLGNTSRYTMWQLEDPEFVQRAFWKSHRAACKWYRKMGIEDRHSLVVLETPHRFEYAP